MNGFLRVYPSGGFGQSFVIEIGGIEERVFLSRKALYGAINSIWMRSSFDFSVSEAFRAASDMLEEQYGIRL